MKLLVGLGNPGAKYARHRHNVGFMAVEAIAEAHGFGAWRARFQGRAAEGRIANVACLALLPETFMNESGRSVGAAMRFYKLGPEDVIVFHDELDLAPGKMRCKLGGGNAGHNGLRSISAHIGNDYVRVRIGIGHPGRKDMVHRYVLHDFAKADRDWLEPLLDAIAREADRLVTGDLAAFASAVAERTRGPESARQKTSNAEPGRGGRGPKPDSGPEQP